ncbi:PAS domain-containing protein [Candidatus Kapabacteria bacterium]|nr:PAS domain-containing protein [Candidatus Kapabacteria bacterium]
MQNKRYIKNRFALDSALVGVWEWDYETNSLSWDDNMFKVYDADPNEFDGAYNAWASRVHPADIDTQVKLLQTCIDNNSIFDTEFRIFDSKGNIKYIIAKAKLFYDTDLKRNVMLGTNWDVTNFKQKDIEYQESLKKFEIIFHKAPIGKALVSLQGKWLDVNDSLCKYLGYSKDELLKLSFQEITHPDDLNEDLNNVNDLLEGKIEDYSMEKRYVKKDGKIVWSMLNVSLMRDHDNKPLYFISQISDIDNVKVLNNTLEEKNNKLEEISKDLEFKVEQLEEFSRIVAHNLRGPSSNIINTISFYHSKLIDEKEAFELLGISSEALASTLANLNQILFVRLKDEIPSEEIEFQSIWDKAKKLLFQQIKETKPNISFNFKIAKVEYFLPYIESIFYNLLSNSLKYRKKDIQLEINVETYQEDGWVYLIYQDNGLGIDLEKHSKKLFQFSQTIHSGFKGTGVGMFITKAQVERLGGTITPISELGKGLKYIIKLVRIKL